MFRAKSTKFLPHHSCAHRRRRRPPISAAVSPPPRHRNPARPFLPRPHISPDRFAAARFAAALPSRRRHLAATVSPRLSRLNNAVSAVTTDVSAEGQDDSGCDDRWKNMADHLTARMWGIFYETGIFLSLCRHGFALVIADMIQSGEQYVHRYYTYNSYANYLCLDRNILLQ